jgi:acyl-CoA hydrolase
MVTTFETNFTVLPKDCNYMTPLIFGGEFLARLDLAAAGCVQQLLQSTPTNCDNAVTYKVNTTFHKPSYMGDLIKLYAEIVELRAKAIKVQVEAHRIPRTVAGVGTAALKNPEPIHVASAEFVFITRLGEKYWAHGLTLGSPAWTNPY